MYLHGLGYSSHSSAWSPSSVSASMVLSACLASEVLTAHCGGGNRRRLCQTSGCHKNLGLLCLMFVKILHGLALERELHLFGIVSIAQYWGEFHIACWSGSSGLICIWSSASLSVYVELENIIYVPKDCEFCSEMQKFDLNKVQRKIGSPVGFQ